MPEAIDADIHERAARRDDAVALAALMNMAGDGIPMDVWYRLAGEGQSPMDIGIQRASRDHGAFSWTNAWLVTIDGVVAGMGFGYRLAVEPDLSPVPDWMPAAVLPFIELEALAPGSFYLNGLAVLPEARGRGIGRRLITEGLNRARLSGATTYSLTMFEKNHPAAALYASFGFREIARRPALTDPRHAHRGDVLLLTRSV